MKKLKWLGSLSIIALFAIVSCLNPIGFNPETLSLSTDMSGSEIGIDNINSAELRFVNHTKSMDIIDVEILIDGETKASSFYSYGDSRIAGGPHAGTSEAILERPTGTNGSGSVKVTGYKVVVSYQKAGKSKLSDSDLANYNTAPGEIVFTIGNYSRSEGDSWIGSGQIQKLAANLLRGKQIVHFYRDKNGNLQVSAGEPDTDDNDTIDFVNSVDITNGTHIDLGNLELGVNLGNLGNLELGVNINNTNPIAVTFSPEVMNAIGDLHIKLADLKAALNAINGSLGDINNSLGGINSSLGGIGNAINNQTASLASIGEIMNQMIVSGNGGVSPNYALVIVQNHTNETISDIALTNKRVITNTGLEPIVHVNGIGAEGQDYAVIRNGSWDFAGKAGTRVLAGNVIAPQQKYLHIYRSTNGSYKVVTTEKDWVAARPEDAVKEYGYLAVTNESSAKIKDVFYVKKYGEGNAAVYDMNNKNLIQWVSPYANNVKTDVRIETGNYAVFASLEGGELLFNGEGRDIGIYAQENANDSTRNVLRITQEDVNRALPPKITYTAFTNGGPPAANSEDAYTTTTMTLSFSADLTQAPAITKIAGSSTFKLPVENAGDARTWIVGVEAATSELVTFKVLDAAVVDALHQVNVYKQSAPPPPSFIPVTDIVVLNGEDFVKGTGKKINSAVVPDNATKKEVTWTIGTADLINFNLLHHYGLGPNYDLNTSTTGDFLVKSSWGYDYWYVAAIVKNGKAEGTRAETLQSFSDVVVDKNGNKTTVTIQALYYDKDKDFVKLYRFNQYTAPNIPSHVYLKFINQDDGYNPAMTRLILYKLDKNTDIGQSKTTANGYPLGLGFYIYTGGGSLVTKEDKDVTKVMGIRYPTSHNNPGKPIAAAPYSNTDVLQLPVVQVNLAQYNATQPANDNTSIGVTNSCVLEFDQPMNRAKGTQHFASPITGINIRLETSDSNQPANWLIAWIGSNQYRTQNHASVKPEDEYKGVWPTSQTTNSSRYWTRGGTNNGDPYIWFILPATLRQMRSGDTATVYAKQWGIKY